MGILTGGWVSVTNGTTTVTFGGGFELEANRVAAGDTIAFGTEPWASWYHITSVDYAGNTAELGIAYGGTTLNQSADFAVNSPGSAFTVPDVHARLKSLIEFLDDFLPAVDGADSVLTLDKDAVGDDAGLILRTAAGERWRVGAFGNDDLRIWRSSDGAAWTLAATVSRSSGDITLQSGLILPGGTIDNAAFLAWEVGTFTPELTFATPGDLANSYSIQRGVYWKLADVVFLDLTLRGTPTFSTASGKMSITQLPFTSASAGVPSGVEYTLSKTRARVTFPTGAEDVGFAVDRGAATIAGRFATADGSDTSCDASHFTSGSDFFFNLSGHYPI